LLVIDGITTRIRVIEHFPFTVGARRDRDLIMADPFVSKKHALFVRENNEIYLVDQDSDNGTYLNGERVVRSRVTRNDRVEFGARGAACVIFNPDPLPTNAAQQLVNEVASWRSTMEASSDVDMLNTFLKAARKLNAFGVLDNVLHILLDEVLRRTHAQRAFVFVRHDDGTLGLLAARDTDRQTIIEDASPVSHDAVSGALDYLATVTDEDGRFTEFMRPYNPGRFLCHALCKTVSDDEGDGSDNTPEHPYVRGVVCLDYPNRAPSMVSYVVLKGMAEGVATLVENAALMKAENVSRYIRQELTIAGDIQQRFMRMAVPDVPYAKVKAVSRACKDIGGDFFDLVQTNSGLSLVIADVSGKGIAAAVVAAILQGMLYSHLARDLSLSEMIEAVNRFLCDKVSGQKFATLVVARLAPNGELELINCGHVPPIIISGKTARIVEEGNLPVGLIPVTHFQSMRLRLNAGDRLLLVTDGVTEAENAEGDFFGTERLIDCGSGGFGAIERAVTEFRGRAPLHDDCTITEMIYHGLQAPSV